MLAEGTSSTWNWNTSTPMLDNFSVGNQTSLSTITGYFFDENGDDPAPAGGVDDVGHPQLSHVSNSLDLSQIL